nr:retrotransposon Gag protein [Tanacetum cinerariifolium]
MASDDNDPDVEYALSRLLQRSTMVEYQNEFEMLISRVTGKSKSLLQTIYISGLKPALQCLLLRSSPKTLDDAFSLALETEARFTSLKLLEFLKSNPSTLGEAFLKAHITEARFEDERSTTDIATTNDLIAGVQVQDLEKTIRHKPDKVEALQTSIIATLEVHEQQENRDNLNEISKENDEAKPPISTNTFGSNGGND